MKNILIIFSFCYLFIACNSGNKSPEDKTMIDSSKTYKKEAITILNKINETVKKGVKKELSKENVNKRIKPLMENYEVLLSKLNKLDSIEVQDYRIRQINEMIDLQIKQGN